MQDREDLPDSHELMLVGDVGHLSEWTAEGKLSFPSSQTSWADDLNKLWHTRTSMLAATGITLGVWPEAMMVT